MSLKEKILELRNNGYSYNKIALELNCSKGSISQYCKDDILTQINIKKKTDSLIIKQIEELSKEKTSREIATLLDIHISVAKKYRTHTLEKIKLTGEEKDKHNSDAVIKRRKKIKNLAIEYKGGKCICCEYNKCTNALEFHHLDPSIKEFNIGKNGATRSWEKVKIELDKCVLLCSNCHREIHAGLIDIDDYL